MNLRDEIAEIKAICATFPKEFAIKPTRGSMPEGAKFRIDPKASFYDRACGFQLVVQVCWDAERDEWLDYSRGSVEELRRLHRPLP